MKMYIMWRDQLGFTVGMVLAISCVIVANVVGIIFPRCSDWANLYLHHPTARMLYNIFDFKQKMSKPTTVEEKAKNALIELTEENMIPIQMPEEVPLQSGLPNFYFLTDGGHIDNLGILSLFHQRCNIISVFDAEEDSQINLSSLHSVLYLATQQKTITLKETSGVCPLEDLKMNRLNNSDPYSHNHVIKIEFEYCLSGAEEKDPKMDYSGILYFAKANLTKSDSLMTRLYSFFNPTFPHETTRNQAFDQNMFTAYSGLGYDVAKVVHTMHKADRPASDSKNQDKKREVKKEVKNNGGYSGDKKKTRIVDVKQVVKRKKRIMDVLQKINGRAEGNKPSTSAKVEEIEIFGE
jgi:hypothetical protein